MEEIGPLERAVIEAAIAYRNANRRYNDAYLRKQETQLLAEDQYNAGSVFYDAVDALIAAREKPVNDKRDQVTDADKRAIDLMLAGVRIAEEETTLKAVAWLYSREGVDYAQSQLAAREKR